MTTKEYLAARKNKNWRFSKVVNEGAFLRINQIHPIKQKAVEEIVAAARKDDAVRRIIIFGSSTRYDCDVTSDLDICIDWNRECYDSDGVLMPFTGNMRKTISAVTNGQADVVNFNYLDDTFIKDAVMKGVTVYEHNV